MQCIVYDQSFQCIAYINVAEITYLLMLYISVFLIGWCLMRMFLIVLKLMS